MDAADFKMPFGDREQNGRWRGFRLAAIAHDDGGMLWLARIAKWIEKKKISKWSFVAQKIGIFFSEPKRAEVLKLVLEQDKEHQKERAMRRCSIRADEKHTERTLNDRALEYGE